MIEWANMFGKALELAKEQQVGTTGYMIGRKACCIKAASGEYYTGISYGSEISAEYDAIRSALLSGESDFERILVVASNGSLCAPDSSIIQWCRQLETSPKQLYDSHVVPDAARDNAGFTIGGL